MTEMNISNIISKLCLTLTFRNVKTSFVIIFKKNIFFSFFLFWRVCLGTGIWFPSTTVLLTNFVFLFDCILHLYQLCMVTNCD